MEKLQQVADFIASFDYKAWVGLVLIVGGFVLMAHDWPNNWVPGGLFVLGGAGLLTWGLSK